MEGGVTASTFTSSTVDAFCFNPVDNLTPLLSSLTTTLCACLAVVTAALSFWRLRHSSHVIIPTPTPTPNPKTTSFSSPTEMTSSQKKESEKEEGLLLLNRGNNFKERLYISTVYYDNDEPEDELCEENKDDGHVDGGDELVVEKWGSPSTDEIRGAGDLGWYAFQDRNVINGSVVRLWDDYGSPRCRRRVSVLVTPTY